MQQNNNASDAALPQAATESRQFGFLEVLRHELAAIVARRSRLNTERGELGDTRRVEEAAWQARLLGLSFSGGGIRSATFNLGVLQALARRGVLRYVDYLSTVSGGGYIGSWLTALTQRRFAGQGGAVQQDPVLEFNARGFTEFEKQIAWSAGDAELPGREDRAIRFLREFSNYLTPKLGLFSGDTWALVAIYVRNALLNQVVLLFAFAALLLAPRFLSAVLKGAQFADALWWLVLIVPLVLVIAWSLGKNLARITAQSAPESKRGIGWICGALILLGVSATNWLGALAEWLVTLVGLLPGAFPRGATDWPVWLTAAVLGSLVSVVTWSGAYAFAGQYRGGAPSAAIEEKFWTQMISYSPLSGAVFGVMLHGVGLALLTGEIYAGFRLSAAPPALMLAILLAGVLHVGLAAKNVSAQYTEWLSRLGGLMLAGSGAWILFNGLVFIGPLLVVWLEGLARWAVSSGWLLTTLASVVFGRRLAAASGALPRAFMQVAPWIFIVGLGVALTALLQQGLQVTSPAAGDARAAVQQHFVAPESRDVFGRVELGGSAVEIRGQVVGGGSPREPIVPLMEDYGRWLDATEPGWIILGVMALFGALATLLSLRIDINVFSLHGMYANRLVRCYLGASVPKRTANPFSGLSLRDDLDLRAAPRAVGGKPLLVHALADGTHPGDTSVTDPAVAYPGPYHLVNTAINLVAGGNLAYQERKAGAFLLSPLYCGFRQDGARSDETRAARIDAYRSTAVFSGHPRHLTLGEAVATSGAAASPNMGYRSTAAFAFLMGVFNIRLGRWVGNPHVDQAASTGSWRKSGPRLALWHLLREVFGLTDAKSAFVYLSDGGHFENLGIYELVRRRCRYIIACDAGADEAYAFEDLANAIRKCRIDLGVEIDLDVRQIAEVDGQRYNGAPCAVGQIRYSDHEVGTILYIKASRRQGVPSDVVHYAVEHPEFPHESTADQFFSESQFESYRRLGHFLAGEILAVSRAGTDKGMDIDRLFRDLAGNWYRPSVAVTANFSALADKVDELFERLRTDNALAYLSRQFYPEWRSLLDKTIADSRVQEEDLVFVPSDEESLRQGFYFCNSLIQLMERAYIDLNLEAEWQHPDNSGWLNVFNHWAWSGMFRVTWAVAAATYGGRFRAFCERRLNLELKENDVHAELVLTGKLAELDLMRSGLNRHEQQQIAGLPVVTPNELAVYRLELHVHHPIGGANAPLLMKFGFGYAVLAGTELVMYRVQDHLRGMGLGRKGLWTLVTARKAELGLARLSDKWLPKFLADFHEFADAGKLAEFRAMVLSVNEEWSERPQ